MTPTSTFVSESRRICEAASDAPWEHTNINSVHGPKTLVCSAYDAETEEEEARQDGDFKFIAHARTALPAALDIIEQQAKRIAELEQELTESRGLSMKMVGNSNVSSIDRHSQEPNP